MIEVLLFCAAIFAALLLEPLANRIGIPFSLLLVASGFAGSEILVATGLDTGLRWESFSDIVLHVLVPVLVFATAYHLPAKALLKELPAVLLLAVPGLILAAIVAGILIWAGMNAPGYFTVLAALITGIIISATDPVAVVALLNRLGAPERLQTLLEGESLLNDAAAVVVYSALVAIALGQTEAAIGQIALAICWALGGGAIAGAAVALPLAWMSRYYATATHKIAISLICAIAAVWLGEELLHASGIVAALVAGLVLGVSQRHRQNKKQQLEPSADNAVGDFWTTLSWLANASLFLLMGVSITWQMFQTHWLAMLIAIVAALVSRSVAVYSLLTLAHCSKMSKPLPWSYQHVLNWGGLRGGVSLALAIALPLGLPQWYDIQSMVYGVVLFSLVVQSTSIKPLASRVR